MKLQMKFRQSLMFGVRDERPSVSEGPAADGCCRAEPRPNQVSILAATRMLTQKNPHAVSITKEAPCLQ